jgi:hypothetical protein
MKHPQRNTLDELAKWYLAHCDGRREHHHGIKIESTDNPGWWVHVDLKGTQFATREFAKIEKGLGPNGHPKDESWISCSVENGTFSGAGDSTRLQEILDIFLKWASA